MTDLQKYVPTNHHLCLASARHLHLRDESVHLVVTSPPYWNLKPYERGASHDIEYALMQRKPGYRSPSEAARLLSLISVENHGAWYQQIWRDVPGTSNPAPYPLALAERLIRMFSFVGDVVLDPFMGSGTTCLAAAKCGRNSIGVEVERPYLDAAVERLRSQMPTSAKLWRRT